MKEWQESVLQPGSLSAVFKSCQILRAPSRSANSASALLNLCVKSGISGLPRKRCDRHILLKSVPLTLDKTAEYTEQEINQKLTDWLGEIGASLSLDHVEPRRRLVDEEYLGRTRDGSRYWVAVSSRKHIPFDPDIEATERPPTCGVGSTKAGLKSRVGSEPIFRLEAGKTCLQAGAEATNQLGEGLGAEITSADLPFIVLLGQDCSYQPHHRGGKIPVPMSAYDPNSPWTSQS